VTTFHDLLCTGAEQHRDRTAVLFDDETLSYEQLLTRTQYVASGFRALGIGSHDHVAIVMENSLECILAWLASSVIGCMEVPINPQYRGDLLLYLLRDCGATAIVCDAAYLPQIAEIADRLPALRLVVVNGAPTAKLPSAVRCEKLDASAHETTAIAASMDAPERVILYTSGTTGPSKGVVHTQKSCLVLARYNAEILQYDESDRLLNFFPLYHQNARYTGLIPALCAGASIRIERKFSSSSFWRTCDADGATAFNYLGSVLRLILNVTPPERVAGTHTIKKAFGAGLPPALWEQCEKRLGIKLTEVYGLSEAPMATVNRREESLRSPVGSAGKAGDLFEVAVVDEEDRILGPDETGEIVMRPKRPDAMMIGYHNKDAATVHAFRNLWFHSGDRGRLSAQGDLYFGERSKDSIRRRGENISAWEVESVLDRHPDIAESAVYALASEDADEEVAAAIVLRRSDADLAEILQFAQQHLPRYAVPTLFRVMPDLPRTPTEKVQKAMLRAAGHEGCITLSDINVRPGAPVVKRDFGGVR
jgi:crotonobetaine/carnitine-CoA ligase